MSNVRVVMTLKISCRLECIFNYCEVLVEVSFDLLALLTTLKRLNLRLPVVDAVETSWE